MPAYFLKDPHAVLDYLIDWDDWLEDDETITSFTLTGTDGIVIESSISAIAENDRGVVVWLSGGSDGETYSVACKVVTSASRTDERSIRIDVLER